jgi:hypothetical protein
MTGFVELEGSCKPDTNFKMCFLDPILFVPGHIYFNAHQYWQYRAEEKKIKTPIMVHANGIGNKIDAFKNYGFWFLSNDTYCISKES